MHILPGPPAHLYDVGHDHHEDGQPHPQHHALLQGQAGGSMSLAEGRGSRAGQC